jgi:tetratricopeptide (TPR) repeat protein
LAIARRHQNQGPLPPLWEGRFRNLEGECHRLAGAAVLGEKRFEESLEHYRTAARLLNLRENEAHVPVVEGMLDEVRRLFALNTAADTETAHALIARVFLIQSPCPEASFWQGLCQVRQGHRDLALASLRTAREMAGNSYLDPPLYLGALLLGEDSPQEAVRYLSEANRLAPQCPFVNWQLGTAILAADKDSQLAARALQRALDRLAPLAKMGTTTTSTQLNATAASQGGGEDLLQRVWLEGLPEGHSFVRRLAVKHSYPCPLMGTNGAAMIRQVRLVLGQAQYRLGNFQEAAPLYSSLLQESAPTVPVLRGLGQSLARLERYEDAYKHLRAAYEQEDPKHPLTAGYLALCGAKGKPPRPEDKVQNVAWALSLLGQFDLRNNAEWAGLCSAVYAEARSAGLPVSVEDQVRLCDLLAEVEATDPTAAAAYEHLAVASPASLPSECAWLYCRAAQQHGCGGEGGLALFARTFQDEPSARAFFAKRQWDFGEVEYTYLECLALQQPGRFPEALGPGYPARAETFLLARSRRQEEAGQLDAASTSVEILLKLAPHSLPAHDRLAFLCYRRGDRDRAVSILADWHALEPANSLPLVRRAIIEQQRGHREGCVAAIDRALQRTRDKERAAVAFLGARLALAAACKKAENTTGSTPQPVEYDHALRWLTECLKEDPNHRDALWCLAAVRSVLGDEKGLAEQAALMHRPEIADGRFQYMAARCHLAAHKYRRVHHASLLAAEADVSLRTESAYLAGWAYWHLQDLIGATAALEKVAKTPTSPSVEHAKALLGLVGFSCGNYEDASKWWQSLDLEKRAAWKFEEPLRATVFLTALLALEAGRFEEAANKFREAGRMGWRGRQLGSLLILALVKEGQRLLKGDNGQSAGQKGRRAEGEKGRQGGQPHRSSLSPLLERAAEAARPLEQAIKAGCRDPKVMCLLALAYQRQGKFREARETLRKIVQPDAAVFSQLGILSLRENQLAQAEQEFAAAWELAPNSYENCYNLLMTRLTLGQVDASTLFLPRAVELAPNPQDQRRWRLLQILVQKSRNAGDEPDADSNLTKMEETDEQNLLALVRAIGHLDTIETLLRTLAAARPASQAAYEAHCEVLLVKAKKLLDRYDWTAAEQLLLPLVNERRLAQTTRATLVNLLGCCACLGQNFDQGVKHFQAALGWAGEDARLRQNLALACEWQGDMAQAELHWDRYFKLLDHSGGGGFPIRPTPALPGRADYAKCLAYEGFSRLSALLAEKRRWASALTYAQQAQRLRPDDPEPLERLFHLCNQAGRPDEARQVLHQLRQVRPGNPQFDFHELDLIDLRHLDGIERLVAGMDRLVERYPNDVGVEDQVLIRVGNLIPFLERHCDQLTGQLNQVRERISRLPSYQVDWSAVQGVVRGVRAEFQKLRRISQRCWTLARDKEQRRSLREMNDYIDHKLKQCQSLGGA